MYVLLEPRSFSISFARSRDISSDAIFANVHRPRPTTYMFEWFKSLPWQLENEMGLREKRQTF